MEKNRPINAEVLPTHTPQLFQLAVERAVELLRAGEVVALPTETVYGLAANALQPEAVRRIYEIKGRPAHNPIIAHVSDLDMAQACVRHWPESASRLAKGFWPGPLTLVLPRAKAIPDIVTAGGDTVGVRWPRHPLIQEVIRRCGFPLAAPSANPSNRVSATTAEHVRRYLGNRVRLIVDGGPSQIGIESTVLDLSVSPPKLLRPGMIGEQALLAVTGRLLVEHDGQEGILKSPGQLRKHYSPRARLLARAWSSEQELLAIVKELHAPLSRVCVIAHTNIPVGGEFQRVSVIPHDAEAFARALYGELHRCDDADAEAIVVEAVPGTGAWRAIADRLRRASATG